LAQAIGQAAIQQGCKVFYRETHILLDELAEAVADGTRKEYMESVAMVPLLIIDDFGMRKLPHTAAEDLLEIIMRRYERFSTLLTSNLLCGALHNKFNAESIFMRTPRSMESARRHFVVFLLRILGAAFSISISLSVALKRPVRSFGAITDSRASSFTDGSARV
jgi:hypothetical protein